jgi:hypothetical protein
MKCPSCGDQGSGLHAKWVLNGAKKRYEPYYYVAHSESDHEGYSVRWCYVKKAIALAILARKKKKKK